MKRVRGTTSPNWAPQFRRYGVVVLLIALPAAWQAVG